MVDKVSYINKMSDMEASPMPLLDPTFFVKWFFSSDKLYINQNLDRVLQDKIYRLTSICLPSCTTTLLVRVLCRMIPRMLSEK